MPLEDSWSQGNWKDPPIMRMYVFVYCVYSWYFCNYFLVVIIINLNYQQVNVSCIRFNVGKVDLNTSHYRLHTYTSRWIVFIHFLLNAQWHDHLHTGWSPVHHHLASVSMATMATIPEFYNGRSIFLTGGTGFMGKQILEKLLRSCPGIKHIYLLIRNKKEKTIISRLEDMWQLPVSASSVKAYHQKFVANPNFTQILNKSNISMK